MASTSIAAAAPSAARPVRMPAIGPGVLLDLALLTIATWLLVYVTSACIDARPEMWGATTLLCINGVSAGIGFAIALRRRYPILMTCFYFDFIFFAIAPIQQIGVKFDPIFSYEYPFHVAIAGSLIFTLFGFIALYGCARPLRPQRRNRGFFRRSIFVTSYYPLVLWSTALAVTMVLLVVMGPYLLTSRDELIASMVNTVDKTGSLLITSFLAPLVLIGSVIGLRGAIVRRERLWLMAFVFSALLAGVISVNPSVLPRFRASALMVFVLLALTRWNNTRLLASFLIAGAAVSPLLNAFRRSDELSASVRPFDTFFAHLDFDCFSFIAHVVYYVDNHGYSYGSNILAALLFFVPRSLWPGKSEHVGYYLWPQFLYYRDVWTDNLSSPPFVEGYFAYGLIGAVVFCGCVWAGFVMLERAARAAERDSPLQLMACLTPIYAIMLLRGPFLVGYSELCGNYLALLAVLILLQIRLRVAMHRATTA